MRLWTLHPKYLDPAGLVALWREALLAQAVLAGKTKGYIKHPQLERFMHQRDPLSAIASYLKAVAEEAKRRKYCFNRSKIEKTPFQGKIVETSGQLLYEWLHLKNKLKKRNPCFYSSMLNTEIPEPHPLFRIVEGSIKNWELVKNLK